MADGGRPWLGVVEGYYGPPLDWDSRTSLVEWAGPTGFTSYVYGPKDDPYHRDRWRDPYPAAEIERFGELARVGQASGCRLVPAISPGLDWQAGDEKALIAKLESLLVDGVDTLGVAWDDVAPGGADLGAAHGDAVAAAVAALGDDIGWVTCPTDYAASEPTAYLRAFVDALPDVVDVLWTGPSIVTPEVTGAQASALGDALGRPLVFADNFPVNDGGMAGVLHLGPYPTRKPDMVAATRGVVCNFMSRPLASRPGLAAAARFWQDPSADRDAAWREVIAEFSGLEPIARACRSWIDAPGPDPELVEWADAALDGDDRLRGYLEAGCRAGLDGALAAEIEPWLAQWDLEAAAMLTALDILASSPQPRSFEDVGQIALRWQAARRGDQQVFGTRFAWYPVSRRVGDDLDCDPRSMVIGVNLTDRLCQAVFARL